LCLMVQPYPGTPMPYEQEKYHGAAKGTSEPQKSRIQHPYDSNVNMKGDLGKRMPEVSVA
jgi:hypothetical protein